MSPAQSVRTADARRTAGHGAADVLGLAAAPSFALMAIVASSAPAMALCAHDAGVPAIDSMTSMYLLMSLFHLPPWLRLARRRRTAARITYGRRMQPLDVAQQDIEASSILGKEGAMTSRCCSPNVSSSFTSRNASEIEAVRHVLRYYAVWERRPLAPS